MLSGGGGMQADEMASIQNCGVAKLHEVWPLGKLLYPSLTTAGSPWQMAARVTLSYSWMEKRIHHVYILMSRLCWI